MIKLYSKSKSKSWFNEMTFLNLKANNNSFSNYLKMNLLMMVTSLVLVMFSTPVFSQTGILKVKISAAQIFDVQWSLNGTTLSANTFTRPYYSVNLSGTSSSGQLTTSEVSDISANNRYFAFFESTTNPGTYGLAIYNSNGTLYWTLHNTGTITALSSDVIFYNGNGFWGTLISITKGYFYGDSDSWTVINNPTSTQIQNYQPGAISPLNAGEISLSILGGITIVESGGAAENSGWSYANGILAPTSGTAVNINAADVVAKMNLANLTIAGSSITINGNITSNTSGRSLTLKSAGEITQNTNTTVTTNAGSIVYWADADGNDAGDVFFNPSASVITNGGHFWIGGGSGTTTWNGLTVGDSYAVGDLGRSVQSSFTHYNGITIQGNAIQTSGGHIKMRGKGKAGDFTGSSFSGGMYLLGAGAMNSGGGNIDIETLSNTGTGQKYGLYNLGAYSFTLSTGNLTIAGDASASAATSGSNFTGRGVFLWSAVTAISTSGSINISGKKSSASGTFGVDIRTPITTAGGNITIEGDALNLTSNLTSNANLILNASSTLTQTGVLTANALILEGAANATLTNANNSINIISGGTSGKRIGALNFNNNKALTVVAAGIFSTGLIELATSGGGDIQLTGVVNSNLSIGDAVKLFADKAVSAGGSSGGNIKIIGGGALAITSGARALLYSGSEALSTGLTTAVGGSVNTRLNVAANTILSSISPALSANGTYALYREATTLPVILVNYEAKSQTNGTVAINWLTASERKNGYFELLKSTDGINFTFIAKVNGVGNANKTNRYSYVDASPSTGENYYLLVQYDQDGTRNELGIRSAKVLNAIKDVQVYPNPTVGLVNLNIDAGTYTQLEVMDIAGKVVYVKSIGQADSLISIDMSDKASGIYQIRLIGEGKMLSKKIIKQ